MGSRVTMSWWMLLLVLCNRYCQSEEISCGITEYEKDGRCCSLCMPGLRLDKDCTESSETLCVACEDGEYQDKWNREEYCLPHHNCDEKLGFQKISEGTDTKNVDCVCQDGKHCSSQQCETCVLNNLCAIGFGVTRKAERYSDTECAPCQNETFSNVASDTEPCKDWQSCARSQLQILPGTDRTDVVCGPRPKKNSTWIYIVVVLLVIIGLVLTFFFRKRRKVKKVKVKHEIQEPPEKGNEVLLNMPEPNLPVEDVDDQDITMQGLPVAQEQGKDYRMSQEEK
ncbi:tumor necrosis factor receptor superfamily member 5 [Rana temporaria]|uniref:tumor necrosis factor receptor superfamily member 5 n=1 Tax=Rana temporaria TaxID=8407 RepID=UPI001AACB948|nr:tumor necrosis factor receptor superfamily member 5 [Rana temporaria]